MCPLFLSDVSVLVCIGRVASVGVVVGVVVVDGERTCICECECCRDDDDDDKNVPAAAGGAGGTCILEGTFEFICGAACGVTGGLECGGKLCGLILVGIDATGLFCCCDFQNDGLEPLRIGLS